MTKTSASRRESLLICAAVAIAALQPVGAAGGFSNGQAASLVLGQPDFVTNAIAPVSATSLHSPSGVVADASGNVWVVDHLNYRVLQFKAPFTNGQAASVVLGQPDLTTNTQNNGGRTASSLGGPNAVAMDASGNLWVADGGANGRVLRYSPPFTNFMAASLVLGVPSFTSVSPGPSQSTVGRPGGGGPSGLAFDGSGNLWVADDDNNRVIRFNAPYTNGQAASVVLGQPDFTSNAAPAAPTASSLNAPWSVAVDAAGSVWVADSRNHRVLKYSPPFTNGQAASVSSARLFSPRIPRVLQRQAR
jgi:streptogramin lyase